MKKRAGPKPDVTIFADASFCPTSHAAGWGAWMVGNGKASSTAGGAFKAVVSCAEAAETMALANALHVAVERGYVGAGAAVMMQSDCNTALARIRGEIPSAVDSAMKSSVDGIATGRLKGRPKPDGREALAKIVALVSQHDLRIIVRHVRGHRSGEGRNWVNRTCDDIAKRAMRTRRAELAGATSAVQIEGAAA